MRTFRTIMSAALIGALLGCEPGSAQPEAATAALVACAPLQDGRAVPYRLRKGQSGCLTVEMARPGILAADSAADQVCRAPVALALYNDRQKLVHKASGAGCASLRLRLKAGRYTLRVVNIGFAEVAHLFVGKLDLDPEPPPPNFDRACVGGEPVLGNGLIDPRIRHRVEFDDPTSLGFIGAPDPSGVQCSRFEIDRCVGGAWVHQIAGTAGCRVSRDEWTWIDLAAGLYRITYPLELGLPPQAETCDGWCEVRVGAARCGDGYRDRDEHCDGGPGCDPDCRLTPFPIRDGEVVRREIDPSVFHRYRFTLDQAAHVAFTLCGEEDRGCTPDHISQMRIERWPSEEVEFLPRLLDGGLEVDLPPGEYALRVAFRRDRAYQLTAEIRPGQTGCARGDPWAGDGFYEAQDGRVQILYDTDEATQIGLEGPGAGQLHRVVVERCEGEAWVEQSNEEVTFADAYEDWRWYDLAPGRFRLTASGPVEPPDGYQIRGGPPVCGDGHLDWRAATPEHCDHGGAPDATCDPDCRIPVRAIADGADLIDTVQQAQYHRYRFDLDAPTEVIFRLCGFRGESCRANLAETVQLYRWPEEVQVPSPWEADGLVREVLPPGQYVVRVRPLGDRAYRLRSALLPQ